MTMLKITLLKQGDWLFRHRSYIPIIFFIIMLAAIPDIRSEKYPFIHELWWEIFCLLVSISGIAIRILTAGFAQKGTSGTITKRQNADALNTTGMYSLLRNPLYFGNLLIWIGLSLLIHLWWITALTVLIFWITYERIIYVEENFLQNRYGETYIQWSDRTPAFIPNFANWQPPGQPFKIKRVIRNEYKTLVALLMLFTLLNVYKESLQRSEWFIRPYWLVLFILALLIFLIMRLLKRLKVF